MNKVFLSPKLLIFLAFIAIYFIWGTTYLAIRVGLEGFPPFLMASIRFILAGVILLAYCIYKGEKLPSRASLIKNAIIGVIVLIGGQGLLFWSEQYIDSGYAAVLVATLPIWFVVMDRKNWNTYFTNPYIITGVILGFSGILLLFKDTLQGSFSENVRMQLLASVAVLIGSICWVVGTLYNRSRPARGSMYSNLGWQLVIASGVSLSISFGLGELTTFTFTGISANAWFSVLYLVIAGSVIAFVAYTWLLTQKPSAVVGTYAYINPIVAVFLGWLLAGEVISFYQLLGMTVILASAILVNITRSQVQQVPAKAVEPQPEEQVELSEER